MSTCTSVRQPSATAPGTAATWRRRLSLRPHSTSGTTPEHGHVADGGEHVADAEGPGHEQRHRAAGGQAELRRRRAASSAAVTGRVKRAGTSGPPATIGTP